MSSMYSESSNCMRSVVYECHGLWKENFLADLANRALQILPELEDGRGCVHSEKDLTVVIFFLPVCWLLSCTDPREWGEVWCVIPVLI